MVVAEIDALMLQFTQHNNIKTNPYYSIKTTNLIYLQKNRDLI